MKEDMEHAAVMFLILLCGLLYIGLSLQANKKVVIMKGVVTVQQNEELNIFLKPLKKRKLFNKSNCVNGDCTFITNTHPNTKNETLSDIHFQIKLYQIRPEFCCSLTACKTVHDFAAQISMIIIRESSCILESEVLFYPHFNEDGLQIGIYTWFMEEQNYIQLEREDNTSLTVPLFKNRHYRLPVYGSVHHKGHTRCRYFYNGKPYKTKRVHDSVDHKNYEAKIWVKTEQTVILTFNCTSEYVSHIDQTIVYVKKSKSLFIDIKTNPSILFPSKSTLAVDAKSQRLKLRVISTGVISFISIDKLKEKAVALNIIIKPLQRTSILWHYWVVFPGLDTKSSGTYNITVITNSVKMWKTFDLVMSQMPKLEVNPSSKLIGTGQNTLFDCVARGINLKGMQWRKQRNDQMTIMAEIFPTDVNTVLNLRLIFSSPSYTDSGIYECSVWTDYPGHTKNDEVELLVFHPGSQHISPKYRMKNNSFIFSGNTTLHITNDRLIGELNEKERNGGKFSWVRQHFVVVIAIILILGVLLSSLVCVVICVLQHGITNIKKQKTILQDSGSEDENVEKSNN